jgi:hypothetical protein
MCVFLCALCAGACPEFVEGWFKKNSFGILHNSNLLGLTLHPVPFTRTVLIMLTTEEENFILYWEQNRGRKKRLVWQLAAGLPLALVIVGGTFITVFSQWYTRAIRIIQLNSGTLVVLIALLLTVVFVVVFSGKHRWDMNEQRYQELIIRKKKEMPVPAAD